ncbi:unnamed protein product [Sympodiomycopsis kandeliae]
MATANEPIEMSKAPLFSLASCVAVKTPPPPVTLAARWKSLYPSAASPFSKLSSPAPFIDVAQGVPSDLPSRELLDRFAQESSKDQHHSYRGAPTELTDALAKRMNVMYRNGEQDGRNAITREDINVTAGCNMASETAFRMIAEPGGHDAIVLTLPYYFNHAMQLSALNISTALLPCAGPSFLPDPQDFKDLLSKHKASSTLPAIKGIILVTPNNPTGSIYPPSLIAEFAQICKNEKIALILDETYREFLVAKDGRTSDVDVQPHTLFNESLATEISNDKEWDWRSTVIHLYSFSKSFAIPGHRLGALVCHPILRSIIPFTGPDGQAQYGPVTTLLDNILIAPPRYDTQLAVAWAMNDPNQVEQRRKVSTELVRRFQILVQSFQDKIHPESFTKWNLPPPSSETSAHELGWHIACSGGSDPAATAQGGYFVFVKHPFHAISAARVAEVLSTQYGLGAIPQDFFQPAEYTAESRHLRISLANVKDTDALRQVPVRMAMLSHAWKDGAPPA